MITDHIIENPQSKIPYLFASSSIIFGLITAFFLYNITYLKGFAIILALIILMLIIKFPEIGIALSFSSGIFKEWLSLNIPIFSTFDFTIAIFGVTYVAVISSIIKSGRIFNLKLDQSYIPLILFTALMMISILYTPQFEYGTIKIVSFLAFNWGLFIFPIFIIDDAKSGRKIINLLLFFGIVVSIFTIYNLLKGFLSGQLIYTYRASFLEVNPISFAGWVGVINVLLISIFPLIKGAKRKIFGILGIIVLTTAVIAANSRGPLLSLIICAAIIIFVRVRKLPISRVIFILTLFIVFIIILFTLLPSQVTNRYIELIDQKQGSDRIAFYTINTRLDFWETSIKLFLDDIRNFFIGIGSGGFKGIFVLQGIIYPHNIFLEVLCEFGLIGLILLCWHLFSILLRAMRRIFQSIDREKKILLFAFLMASVFNLLGAQFTGDININRRLWFFLGTIVAMLSILDSHRIYNRRVENE